MAQDKTPKRGCRWPVVDNPHRSRLTRCPSHDWSSTATSEAHQWRRSWGGEVLTPWKYVERVRVCFDTLENITFFSQHCCCIAASFSTSRMNSWTLSLHWSCLCWRCYHPYVWSAPSRVSSNQCLCCYTGLKLSLPKTKLQKVGAGDPPSKILIDAVPVEGVEEFIYLGSK